MVTCMVIQSYIVKFSMMQDLQGEEARELSRLDKSYRLVTFL